MAKTEVKQEIVNRNKALNFLAYHFCNAMTKYPQVFLHTILPTYYYTDMKIILWCAEQSEANVQCGFVPSNELQVTF